MRRVVPLPLLLSGCFSFDGLVLPDRRVDAYDFPTGVIPGHQLELVTFPSGDGVELYGLWAHQDDPDAPVLLHLHGNGGAMSGKEFGRLETHWSWGFRVFTVDYRGFGLSGGDATRDGVLEEDGLAAARYVSDTTGIPPEEIPWIALSLGGAVAVHTQDEIPAKAMVLESVFATAEQLTNEATPFDLPAGWFFEEPFDNAAAIARTTAPVFVIHGLADDFVAPTHGRSLHRAAPGTAWLWQPEGVAHSDIHRVMPEAYRDAVLAFLHDPQADPLRALD